MTEPTDDEDRKKLAILQREIALGLEDAAAGRLSHRTAREIAEEVLREAQGEEPSPAYRDAIRRLDEATDAAARHMRIEPDPDDEDDAVVERKDAPPDEPPAKS